jgi:hypothetical protein
MYRYKAVLGIRMRIFPCSHKNVERSEIMLAKKILHKILAKKFNF